MVVKTADTQKLVLATQKMHAKESDGAGGDVSAPIEVATFDLGEPLM